MPALVSELPSKISSDKFGTRLNESEWIELILNNLNVNPKGPIGRAIKGIRLKGEPVVVQSQFTQIWCIQSRYEFELIRIEH